MGIRKINVLSLCDGMSCGHIALDKVGGVEVENYFASEIKEIAIKVTQYNYPTTIQVGDVNKISYKNGILHTENGDFETNIDLVIFGSPCQSFSIAMPTKHRVGLEDVKKSGLFYECSRVLKEINPKYFLMENVASMKNSDKDSISLMLGVEPIMINSSTISPALRKRYYWTNINVGKINERDISFQSILNHGYTDRVKARCLTVSDSRPNTTPVKMFHRYYSTGFTTLLFKSKDHYLACKDYYDNHYKGLRGNEIPINDTNVFDGVRYMEQEELERCQTVPQGYTKCLTRNEAADVLGDGWTIDVIAHIFNGML